MSIAPMLYRFSGVRQTIVWLTLVRLSLGKMIHNLLDDITSGHLPDCSYLAIPLRYVSCRVVSQVGAARKGERYLGAR